MRRQAIPLALSAVLSVCALLALPAAAEMRRPVPASTLRDLAFSLDETRIGPQHQDLVAFRTEASPEVLGGFDRFLKEAGGDWVVIGDRLTGLPALAEGKGIPWIPGSANSLTAADIGMDAEAAGQDVPADLVARRALEFIVGHPEMFRVSASDLHLNEAGSGPFSDYLYFVDFRWSYAGIPVEGARLVFRLNHGNLVQFGQEYVSDSIAALDPNPSISVDTAWESLWGFVGGPLPLDHVIEPGRLLVVPVSTPQALTGLPVEPGKGLAYRLVYVLAFRRDGDVGTWQARVDAHTGEIVSFVDTNEYGVAHGGANPPSEKDRPFRFADLGGSYSDVNGLFSGSTATSSLKGKYVQIKDACGTISLSTATGDLNFGTSTSSDCGTPGFGGNGNTRASRNQYYMTTWANARARVYLPNNTWLNGSFTDNVNGEGQPCNAFWDGTNLNMFKTYSSGGYWCMNTGEDPGTGFHEWGHGFDQNDGGGPPDLGTGESDADTTAILQVHLSCFDNGSFKYLGRDLMCDGYGNACTACSGVREADYAQHTNAVPATPDQLVSGSAGYKCNKSSSYKGPCGYEGHCESEIITQAFWDLAARDLVAWGMDQATAWQHVDRLWYLSRPTASSAYSCPGVTTTDGCGVGSLFSVLRVVDDCDGNLANGTPHASAIYAAMNRHKIACSSVNNSDQQGCCPHIPPPALQGTVTNTALVLNWQSVSGASGYDVLRGEMSCTASFLKIASVSSGTTSYTDSGAIRGIPYFYRVQPTASTAACPGDVSNCAALTIKLAVSASADPSTGPVPLSVTFTAQAAAGTEPYTYTWDFGDGGAGSGSTAQHTYTTPNTYTAKVSVTDGKGETATGTVTVTATVAPPSVTSVTKAGSPFHLLVSGTNFHSSCTIKINGAAVPSTVYLSATSLEAQGGNTLKAMVPKGQTVQVTVTNNDDGGVSAPFSYKR